MKISDSQRREVAENLRNMCDYECRYAEQFYELLNETVMDSWDRHGYRDVADRLADLIEPCPVDGETSDGYHTFNELYHHRAVLFSVIVSKFADKAWKSKLHADGTMFDGMFIVGIGTPDGQATYHYDIDPYWSLFRCAELERAPEWDGHTSGQAIERIGKLADLIDRPTCRKLIPDEMEGLVFCSNCGAEIGEYSVPNYCPNCGAEVVE